MRTWAGSTRSMLQSLKPTLASEKVLVSGGLSMARAVVSVGLRSGPYQGFARAPFVGLRVVATSSMGRSAMADASGKITLALGTLAQPPRLAAAPADASSRKNTRRDTARRAPIRQTPREQKDPVSAKGRMIPQNPK